jgi:hypothetical protein
LLTQHKRKAKVFAGELCKKMLPGMKRPDANEVVKKLVGTYEDKLKEPPAGKKFEECTNIRTLQPTEEWYITHCNVIFQQTLHEDTFHPERYAAKNLVFCLDNREYFICLD